MALATWFLTLSVIAAPVPVPEVRPDTGKASKPPVVQPSRDRAKPQPRKQPSKPKEPVLKRRKPPGRPD
jgi:hypothetical protein